MVVIYYMYLSIKLHYNIILFYKILPMLHNRWPIFKNEGFERLTKKTKQKNNEINNMKLQQRVNKKYKPLISTLEQVIQFRHI